MGNTISTAAHGFGTVIGSVVSAPFKSVFRVSCDAFPSYRLVPLELRLKNLCRDGAVRHLMRVCMCARVWGICSGTWDIACFIEHLCISDLVKLLMISGLCYITLLFLYLLFKVGIVQCVVKSLCKMCWAACETYWCTLGDIIFFLWHKISNVKRVNRRQRRKRSRDIELGYSSSGESESVDVSSDDNRDRKLVRSRRQHFSSQLSTDRSTRNFRHHQQQQQPQHHGKMKRGSFSVRVMGSSRRLKSSRHLKVRRVRDPPAKGRKVKRRIR